MLELGELEAVFPLDAVGIGFGAVPPAPKCKSDARSKCRVRQSAKVKC